MAVRLVPGDGRARRGYADVTGAALLGGPVLCVLLPLVQAGSGGIARLWWLFSAAVGLAAVFGWATRRAARFAARRHRAGAGVPRIGRDGGRAGVGPAHVGGVGRR